MSDVKKLFLVYFSVFLVFIVSAFLIALAVIQGILPSSDSKIILFSLYLMFLLTSLFFFLEYKRVIKG